MKKIEIKKKSIPGVFGEKKQKVVFYQNKNFSKAFFFIHGLYSSCSQDKYFLLTKGLVKNDFNVFLFDRSRKKGYKDNFDIQTKSFFFKGKSFNEEINDVKIAFKFFLSFLPKKKEITIVGFSLGGTLASFLIKEYKNHVKNIFLFGSGISTKNKNRPITDTYPRKEDILKNFSMFKGKIILVQGTKDNVVPIEEAREVITNKESLAFIRKLIILKDVDHQFKYINDRKSKKINKIILDILINES